MTIGELRKLLQDYDDDDRVRISVNGVEVDPTDVIYTFGADNKIVAIIDDFPHGT